QFHGTLFHFFRNDKLDANSFFSNRSGFPRPALRWNQLGGNLGGPVKRNRAFFFFNYEGAEVRRPSQVTGTVATPALIAQLTPSLRKTFEEFSPRTFEPTANPLVGFHRRNDRAVNDEHTFLARGDVDLTRHRLTLRHNYNHQDVKTPTLPPAMPRVFPTRFHNVLLQDSWILSPAVFNELRLGLNRTDLDRREEGRDRVPAWVTVSGVNVNISQPGYLHFIPTTYTLADNLSLVRGRHTLKTGTEIRITMNNRDQGGQPTHMYNSLNDLIADRPNRIRLLFGGGKGLKTTNYGFYVQDDWRVSPKLQVNMGLRYEYSPPLRGGFNVSSSDPFGPFIRSAQDDMFVADRNNWAPRLGAVYDPFGNQRFVIRAGGAISYLPQQAIFIMDMAFIDPRLPFVAISPPPSWPLPQPPTRSPFLSFTRSLPTRPPCRRPSWRPGKSWTSTGATATADSGT
ncbi:MAG: TonB-dependent receptor domain-containing protein, partial [Bryobacteraceae bacterium]